MKRNLLFMACLLGIVSVTQGQNTLPADLLSLSRFALDHNFDIRRSELSVENARADLTVEKGAFDFQFNSKLAYEHTGYSLFERDPRNEFLKGKLNTNGWDLTTALQKKFRTSQLFEVGVQYAFDNNNLPFNDFSDPLPRYRGNYIGTLNLSITQPLLRGRGKRITQIPETMAELFIEVTDKEAMHLNSAKLTETVNAYWGYYTAYRALEIYRQNEDRARRVLEMTQELVQADKKPFGDLAQIEADLANQEGMTYRAEQNLYARKMELGRTLGLSEAQSREIGDPEDDYPETGESLSVHKPSIHYFMDLAKENRTDLEAAEIHKTALEEGIYLARDQLRPQLDLGGFGFYGNASQGTGKVFKASSLTSTPGRYWGVGAQLTFSFNLNNRVAKGNLTKSKLAYDDQVLAREDLERNIDLNLKIAYSDFNQSLLILDRAQVALQKYEEAFENEQERFTAGLTTLLNLIIYQERWTNAQLGFIEAQEQYAQAILLLRHETGTLLSEGPNGVYLDKEKYYTIP